jgi:hypothetical protein
MGSIVLNLTESEYPSYKNIQYATMRKSYNLEMFIQEILEANPYDHGFFIVGDYKLYYQDGILEYEIPDKLKNGYVGAVKGVKGFDIGDYIISLVSPNLEKEEKKPADNLMDILREMQQELQDVRMKYAKKIGVDVLSIKANESGSIILSTDYRNGVFGFDIEV